MICTMTHKKISCVDIRPITGSVNGLRVRVVVRLQLPVRQPVPAQQARAHQQRQVRQPVRAQRQRCRKEKYARYTF